MSHVVIVDSNRAGLRCIEHARALGHRVTFVAGEAFRMYADDPAAGRSLAAAHQVIRLPSTFAEAPVRGALARILACDGIDALICLLDYAVPAVAGAAAALGIPFSNRQAVHDSRDKLRCRERLAACGVPSPAFAAVDDEAACREAVRRIGLPVTIKPRLGGSSQMVRVLRDERELAEYWHGLPAALAAVHPELRKLMAGGLLVEAYLDGPLMSAEIGVAGGRVTTYIVSGRRRAARDTTCELGGFMPAPLKAVQRATLERYLELVVGAIGFDLGMAHAELILTPEGPRLVEFNPRLMGGDLPLLYEAVTGNSIYDELIRLHLGGGAPDVVPQAACAASCRKLQASRDGVVRADPFTGGDDDGPPPRLLTQALRAGAAFHRDQVLARFVVTAPTAAEAERRADRVQRRASAASGVPARLPEPLAQALAYASLG